ncbi:hypothetical protein SAMN05421766_10258 [Zobellia uliginosa]|uniref:Uncharacterized protein n=2 Tax=Zobellia uliginosa TaxID=143224 RepID=A0ABY1KLB1_9FLAO|nr:hypothetical protein SAMN05421766_10258 [Zobellia uliginosa]
MRAVVTHFSNMKFKDIINSLKTYIFFGIVYIGFLAILAGLGYRGRWRPMGDLNPYFVAFGIVLIIPLLYWIIKTKLTDRAAKAENEKRIEKLKKDGQKIEIDLNKVKVNSSSWQEQIITDNTRYAGLNEVVGRGDRNLKLVNRTLNQISFKKTIKGRTITYRESIEMDTDNLKIHFALKKKTILYIDPDDRKNMYLDLEFLK